MLNERQLLRAQSIAASSLSSLRNWFPVTLEQDEIVWRHVPERFTASFFADTLHQQDQAARQLCRTGFGWLSRLEPALTPSAFIFHTSRCGSTLLTQLLSTLPSCIVMSEPPVIDAFLRAHRAAPDTSGGSLRLRQLILALGQRRSDEETRFFIKLDSWHIHDLPLLRAAFPDTPCWFLYRQPDAILASHQRQRGPQMVPGMVAALAAETLEGGDLDGYCANILAGFFSAALTHASHLECIHYRQLPAILWQTLLPEMGLHCTTQELVLMQKRAGFHAKRDSNPFTADKPPVASHSLAQHQVTQLYAQMERYRTTI